MGLIKTTTNCVKFFVLLLLALHWFKYILIYLCHIAQMAYGSKWEIFFAPLKIIKVRKSFNELHNNKSVSVTQKKKFDKQLLKIRVN